MCGEHHNTTLIQLGSKYISYNTVFDLNVSSVQTDPDATLYAPARYRRVSFRMRPLAQPYACIRDLTTIDGYRYLTLFVQDSSISSLEFRMKMVLTSFFPHTYSMEYTFDEALAPPCPCLTPIKLWIGEPGYIDQMCKYQKMLYKNLKEITI